MNLQLLDLIYFRKDQLTPSNISISSSIIEWTPLSYYGFQLVIPISTTHSIDDDVLYFIRHVDDEAPNQTPNPNSDSLELYTVDASNLNNLVISLTNISVPDFTSNINGYTAFSGIPIVGGGSLDPLREIIMNYPELRQKLEMMYLL